MAEMSVNLAKISTPGAACGLQYGLVQAAAG
jgi:hypothetical protein